MTVADSYSEGDIISLETSSVTTEIDAGMIVEVDSSGDVIIATTTRGNPMGVAATKVASRTSASQEKISVQVTGIASVVCGANEAFSVNDRVTAGTASGVATTGATFVGTTYGSEDARKAIGRVYEADATTEGTTVRVLLNIN